MDDFAGVVEIVTPPVDTVREITAQIVIVDIGTQSGSESQSARSYRHIQEQAATVWVISHGLGFDPAGLTVISSDGFVLDDFGVQYLAAGDSLRLAFDIAVSGVAYLS